MHNLNIDKSLFLKLKAGEQVFINEVLSVSQITENDINDILIMLQNPNVCRYLYFAPSPENVYREYFQPLIDATAAAVLKSSWPPSVVLVFRDSSGDFKGMSGLTNLPFLEGNYEIGYQIPEQSWGEGIASIGCSILLAIAFEELDAHKLTADCYAANTGSIRVLEKSGFLSEGLQKSYYRLEKSYDDRCLFGFNRDDWQDGN